MFAARAFDPTVHGGFIAFGEPTVFIGGLPAARIGDPHVCMLNPPLMPHVGGWIATGSMSVLIGGQGAARQTDLCSCAVAPVSLPSTPAGPPKDAHVTFVDEEGRTHEVLWSKSEEKDKDKDGLTEEGKWEKAAHRAHEKIDLTSWLRYEQDVRTGYYEGKYRIVRDPKTGERVFYSAGEHEAGGHKQEHTITIGDDKHPFWQGRGRARGMHGDAGVDNLVGTDGSRYGVAGYAGGQAAAGSVDAQVKVDAAAVPVLTPAALALRKFAGINADVTVSAGASGGSAGAGIGGFAYYENGRINLGLKGKAAEWVGLHGDAAISIGVMEDRRLLDFFRDDPGGGLDPAVVAMLIDKAKAAYAAHRLAAIPNTIVMGCRTVMIGG